MTREQLRYDKSTAGGVKQKQRHLPDAIFSGGSACSERTRAAETCRKQGYTRGGPEGPPRTRNNGPRYVQPWSFILEGKLSKPRGVSDLENSQAARRSQQTNGTRYLFEFASGGMYFNCTKDAKQFVQYISSSICKIKSSNRLLSFVGRLGKAPVREQEE